MLTLAMAVLCIALYPVSAQKSETNENDKFYKAREIIDARGDLSKAAELLKGNIKEYPKHIRSYILLASLEHRSERYGEELRLLDLAKKRKDANLMDMLQFLAQLHYNLKQYDESDRIYSQMRDMEDTEQLPMIGLARSMIAREQNGCFQIRQKV